MRSSVALLSLLALLCAAASLVSAAGVAPTPNSVVVNADGTLTVDGAPFKIKGIAYSPVPVGESVHFPPYGDYFTADYVYIWNRDLPAIASMGLNTLRIYGWNNSVDHSGFLDACTKYNLKVMLTHYVGTATETPVSTPEQRAAAIAAFVTHVGLLGDHPAILAWSFGNEINGAWNGFKAAIALSYGCNDWLSGCENIQPASPDSSSPCYAAQACLYSNLFGWMNSAMSAAGAVSTRPMTSTLADVDYLISGNPTMDRIPRFQSYLSNMSLLAVQLYRGQTLVPYFTQYASETSKPLLIGEYGVDAMNDPCGWMDNYNSMRPCYNWNSGAPGTAGGSEVTVNFTGCAQSWDACHDPGVVTQTAWDHGLADEILSSTVTVGGILMEWHDEYWKNIGTEDHCNSPCPTDQLAECSDPANPLYTTFAWNGGTAGCTYKAHISCSNFNTSHHDLCGYWLASAPDRYVNEAWFGLNGVSDCGYSDVNGAHRLSSLAPRPVVASLQSLFGGSGSASVKSCAQLQPCWACSQSQGAAGVLAGRCNAQCNMDFQGPSSSSSTAGAAATQASSSSTATAGGNTVFSSSSGAAAAVESSSGAAVAQSSSGIASSTATPTVTAVASSSSSAAAGVAPSSSSSAASGSVVVSSSSSAAGSAALSSSTGASASAGASTGSGSATGSTTHGGSTGSAAFGSSSSGAAASGTGSSDGSSGLNSGAVTTIPTVSSLLALALAAASLLAAQRS